MASAMILTTIARFEQRGAPVKFWRIGNYVAMSIAFEPPPKVALGEAMAAIQTPVSIHAGRSGVALAFQKRVVREIIPILAALVIVHPRRNLRALHPSAYDSVDAVFGWRRRDRGISYGVHDHCLYRQHPAHRHRRDERHHDDRRRVAIVEAGK